MRHPKKSFLADVLKTKKSYYNGKKTKLKDADMKIRQRASRKGPTQIKDNQV